MRLLLSTAPSVPVHRGRVGKFSHRDGARCYAGHVEAARSACAIREGRQAARAQVSRHYLRLRGRCCGVGSHPKDKEHPSVGSDWPRRASGSQSTGRKNCVVESLVGRGCRERASNCWNHLRRPCLAALRREPSGLPTHAHSGATKCFAMTRCGWRTKCALQVALWKLRCGSTCGMLGTACAHHAGSPSCSRAHRSRKTDGDGDPIS